MCQMCNIEEEKKLLLHCSGCSTHVHPGCLIPPWTGMLTDDWSCYACKEKVEGYFKERDAYITELSKRYDIAVERKSKILDIIRSLDDIIYDQYTDHKSLLLPLPRSLHLSSFPPLTYNPFG